MKPIISRLSSNCTLFFFPLLLILRSKWKNYILLLFGSLIVAGCFEKFYSKGTVEKIDASVIERLKSANKYFIIHYSDSVLSLYDVSINEQLLTGKTGDLLPEHTQGLSPDKKGGGNLKSAYSDKLLAEVHLYVNKAKSETMGNPMVQVPLSDIYRMDVYEFDKKRTNSSTAISIIGIGVVVVLAVVVIAASASTPAPAPSTTGTGCGCPQVYVEQKGEFVFQNGIFSGAVYSNLERTDYLPLKAEIAAGNTSVRLRIAGHNDEIQQINSLQLLGIYHQPGAAVLADREGRIFTVNNPQQPAQALADDQKGLKNILINPDGNSFAFDTYEEGSDYSHAYLTFKNTQGNKKAKFVIRAKNSMWSSVVNNEYTLLFGEDYLSYRDFREKTAKKRMQELVLRQGLPIKVFVGNGDKWDYAGYFPLTGTEGYRDMIMELKLPENNTGDVRIKLETVYRFWDMDYAAIDFSYDVIFQKLKLDPLSVIHSKTGDKKDELGLVDKKYVELKGEESIDVEFRVPALSIQNVSFFLVSSGYYHIQNSYPVKVNVERLKKFQKAAEFDRFSKEKYYELQQWKALVKK